MRMICKIGSKKWHKLKWTEEKLIIVACSACKKWG